MSKKETSFAGPIIAAAAQVAKTLQAQALFAYVDAVENLQELRDSIKPPTQLILICRDAPEEQRVLDLQGSAMRVPAFTLTRMAQIKMATLIAFSKQVLKPDDVFVFLVGSSGRQIDSIVTMRVGEEYELFQSVGQPKLTEHIRRPVFEKVFRLALELAYEGREGKSVGALFVIGDYREVRKCYQEGRINPFRGYHEKERNILDDSMDEIVKELAKLDGAFIIKGNGVVVEACAILKPGVAGESLPQGMGSRHVAAAAITATTRCIAVTLSESTGDVRIWRRGSMITQIEKSLRASTGGQPLREEP